MSRYRWYLAKWPDTPRGLAKRIKTFSFKESMHDGFVIDRVRDEYVEARYVEKLDYTDHVIDPFGNELQFERVEYRFAAFRAGSVWPGLELIDAPRGMQGLLSRFSEATDFGVSVEALSVDVLRWAQALEHELATPLFVDSLQIGSLRLNEGIQARVVVQGEQDVREACLALTKGRKYTIEKVQLRLGQGLRSRVLLSGTASAKLDGHDSGELLEPLRRSLIAACS